MTTLEEVINPTNLHYILECGELLGFSNIRINRNYLDGGFNLIVNQTKYNNRLLVESQLFYRVILEDKLKCEVRILIEKSIGKFFKAHYLESSVQLTEDRKDLY